jgi:uncharacterized protein
MGVFALETIQANELLVIWSGELYSFLQLTSLPLERQQHSVQVEEDFYLVPTRNGEPTDFINHSCQPNLGLAGQIALRALREIAAGEELCYDYAMSDGSPYDEFSCNCGTADCRGQITGNDWQLPSLQAKYAGWFSPYLQRRIALTATAGSQAGS